VHAGNCSIFFLEFHQKFYVEFLEYIEKPSLIPVRLEQQKEKSPPRMRSLQYDRDNLVKEFPFKPIEPAEVAGLQLTFKKANELFIVNWPILQNIEKQCWAKLNGNRGKSVNLIYLDIFTNKFIVK